MLPDNYECDGQMTIFDYMGQSKGDVPTPEENGGILYKDNDIAFGEKHYFIVNNLKEGV